MEDIISEAQKRLKDAEAKSSVLGKVFKQCESSAFNIILRNGR